MQSSGDGDSSYAITIIGVTGLLRSCLSLPSKCYVTVTVHNAKFKTKRMIISSAPTWIKAFKIAGNKSSAVEIRLFRDPIIGRDRLIGGLRMTIGEGLSLQGTNKDFLYPLECLDGNPHAPQGSICLRIVKDVDQIDTSDKSEKIVMAEQMRRDGNNYLKAGRYHQAIVSYTKAIELNPDDPYCFISRAESYMALEHYSSALVDYQASYALQSSSPSSGTLIRIAQCHLKLGFPSSCISTLDTVFSLDPTDEVALELKASAETMIDHLQSFQVAKNKGDWELAELSFQRVSAKVHGEIPPEWKCWQAEIALAKQDWNTASQKSSDALRLAPSSSEALTLRALILFLTDSIEDCVAHLDLALQVKPDHEMANALLRRAQDVERLRREAKIAFNAENYDHAVLRFDEILQIVGEREHEGGGGILRAIILYDRGVAHLKLGNYVSAVTDTKASLVLRPNYHEALRSLAQAHFTMGEHDEAMEALKQALAVCTDDPKISLSEVQSLQAELEEMGTVSSPPWMTGLESGEHDITEEEIATLDHILGGQLDYTHYVPTADIPNLSGHIYNSRLTNGPLPARSQTNSTPFPQFRNFSWSPFQTQNDTFDGDAQIALHQSCLNAMEDSHPEKPGLLVSLGRLFAIRFQCSENPSDEREAIKWLEAAVRMVPDSDPRKIRHLRRLEQLLLDRFQRLNDITDITKAIPHVENVARLISDSDPQKPLIISDLGNYFLKRFDALGNVTDLHKAVSTHETVLQIMSTDHPERAMCLQKLANAYSKRWERLMDVADIHNAISYFKTSLDITPHGHPSKPGRHHFLGSVLVARYDILEDIADLDNAISHYDSALQITSYNYPHRSGFLHLLGKALLKRFRQLSNTTDINRSILSLEDAVSITTNEHPSRAAFLDDLGESLFARVEKFGDTADLEKAISHLTDAVSITPIGHPDRHTHLNMLGNVLFWRFKRYGDFTDLHASISNHEEAVRITAGHPPYRAGHLNDLAIALWARFERLGDIADLDTGISCLEDAIHVTSDGLSTRLKGRLLNTLGTLFCKRHERSGELADVDKAIANHEAAARTVIDNPHNASMYLNNLGNSLFTRFERLGNLADVNESIRNLETAKRLTSDEHPTKPDILNNLGISLFQRFERQGVIADIDEAIVNHEASLSLSPTDHSDNQRYFTNIGKAFYSRFNRLGDVLDINKAISNVEVAVRITPEGHSEMPTILHSLGLSFLMRYEKCSNITDLEMSIANIEAAIRLTADDHPEKPGYLNTLGNAIQKRFKQLDDVADLERAISAYDEAFQLCPDQHPAGIGILNNVGTSLMERFESRLEGDVEDMNKAISCLKTVADTMANNDPRLSTCLTNLANALMARFAQLQDFNDLIQGLFALCRAARSVASPPSHRYRAASLWSKFAHVYHKSPIYGLPSILDAYTTCLDLLPRLAWRGLNIDARYQGLLRANTVACDAAAAALMMDNSEKALEWLEQGRSIVWGQTLELRSPFDDLSKVNPDLASTLSRISVELEQVDSQRTDTTAAAAKEQESIEHIARRHRRLADEWETSVAKVRELPGFQQFLQPKQFSQLRRAASAGPVVVLNVSTHRCDALILVSQQDPLRHIRLDKFTYDRAQDLQRSMRELLSKMGVRERHSDSYNPVLTETYHQDEPESNADSTSQSNAPSRSARTDIAADNERHVSRVAGRPHDDDDGFRDILAELWHSVVKQVLDFLGLPTSYDKPLRRIWWCPTGPLSFLPIHAAGVYPTSKSETPISVTDYAISSYTPTLNALLNSSRVLDPGSLFKLIAVIQPNTPGASSLPGTEEELKYIQKHASRFPTLIFDVLERKRATVSNVLSRMKECSWVHLACHGVQEIAQPAKSALLLEDGRLDLAAIIKQHLPHADFVFLSACQTATGDERRPDESIHLAAGMLLAGYRGVVGTMWSIRDSDAPFVADELYAQLLRDERPNSTMAARALHTAILRLRERHKGRSFASWVPFIHVGM